MLGVNCVLTFCCFEYNERQNVRTHLCALSKLIYWSNIYLVEAKSCFDISKHLLLKLESYGRLLYIPLPLGLIECLLFLVLNVVYILKTTFFEDPRFKATM